MKEFKAVKEKRIARLAYNSNGWIMPSGPYGKSKQQATYEAQYGFGHEEWLFDLSKIIDGYHYGFLEPIREHQDYYSRNSYDVGLYTVNGYTKKRYWVGEIKDLDVISREESEVIINEYIKRGWYQEMESQILSSGAKASGFVDWKDLDLFNVRFKPKDVRIKDPYFELPHDHHIYKLHRYTFIHFNNEFKIPDDKEIDDFVFTPSHDNDLEDEITIQTTSHIIEPKSIEIEYLHQAISKKLTKILRSKYGISNVTREYSFGSGCERIDIIVRSENEGIILYEIKTYNSLKTNIREAFGQLMEYAFYPNNKRANQLIVLTQKHENIEKAITYFQYLRDTFKIPIYYQWFDFESGELSEKF